MLSANPRDFNARTRYFSSLKCHKKSIKLAKKNFQNNILQRLNDANDKDQNQFWKIMKELNKLPRTFAGESISASQWHTYFSSLLAKSNKQPESTVV
jgi:Asp-tRNA(Asn)/Glu-tRNA(Gln) amidotransferase B subunit